MMWHIALLGLLSLLHTQSPATQRTASQATATTAIPPLHWLGETPAEAAMTSVEVSAPLTPAAAKPAGGTPLLASAGVARSVTTGPAPAALPPWPEVRRFARQLLSDNARLTLQLTRQGQHVSQWPLAPDWALLAPSSITIQLEQNGDRLTARFVDPRPKLRYQRWHLLDQSILSVQGTLNEVLLDLSGPVDWRFPLPEAPTPPKPNSSITGDPAEDNVSAVIPPQQPLQKQRSQSERPAVKLPVAKQNQVRQPHKRPQTTAPK